jgi:hypothetical protein
VTPGGLRRIAGDAAVADIAEQLGLDPDVLRRSVGGLGRAGHFQRCGDMSPGME